MQKRLRANIFLKFAFVVIGIVGCSNSQVPDLQDTDTTTNLVNSAYPPSELSERPTNIPYPGLEVATTIPQTVAPAELPLTLPQPASGMATLGGVVIDGQTRRAPPESLLFLGEVVYTDKGLPVISVDRQNDPVIVLQPNGTFAFEDVIPGEYGIVFFTPDYSFLLENPDSGESLIITLAANKVYDIGLMELSVR